MVRYIKIVMVMSALFLVVLSDSMVLWAQPTGIMSPQQREPQYQTLSSDNARFVFGQVSDSDKDKFMLDTLTGRLWRIAESGKVGMFLMPVSYRVAEGEYSALPGNNSDSGNK
ncbi:MAG: hypothetical protein JW944_01205 [Deltaproteobacteria bacterium]|nr:hypothetical protein [Deltaproteobacteria bacterium]